MLFIIEPNHHIYYLYCVDTKTTGNESFKKGNSMKRQKRDKLSRAHSKGYQAGITGHSKEKCPFQTSGARFEWLGGWREAIGDRSIGLVSR